MAALVVAGAMLKCSVGSVPGALQVQGNSSVRAGAHPVATVADKTGLHFGVCPNQGTPAPVTCAPIIPGQWGAASATVRAGGMPVLTTASICNCGWGGVISVVSPGQSSVMAG